ncbi:MAG TPA: VWA domain-containing protein [Actinocrinis sp.]|jgi:hypothetical protein
MAFGSSGAGSDFAVTVHQNKHLPAGGRLVEAVLSVQVSEILDAVPGGGASSAEIIIVDCSASMKSRHKFDAARQATVAALQVLRDGAAFAVVGGSHRARSIFPPDGGMAIADAGSRAAAVHALGRLRASGGTKMSRWLELARQTFDSHPAQLRHALLLTDGRNGDLRGEMDRALQDCQGVFTCDCRGVGTGWRVEELRRIATALGGTVDIVPEPDGLAREFAAVMRSAMHKQVPELTLRVWTPVQASIRSLKQVAPTVEDLAGRAAPRSAQIADYSTGAWGAGESREYHLVVETAPGEPGHEILAARASLVVPTPGGPAVVAQGLVTGAWTADAGLFAALDPHVAHYTGQAELAAAIRDGLAARRAGDRAGATALLGRAVQLAGQSGNAEAARLLAAVVDVDPVTGTAQLKQRIADADEMALDARSTRTVMPRRRAGT